MVFLCFIPFILIFSCIAQIGSPFSTNQYFEVFISKDVFLNELNREIYDSLTNQTFQTNISFLHNTSISEKLMVTSINLTLNTIEISNKSSFDSNSMDLKNCSVNLNFSMNYIFLDDTNTFYYSTGCFLLNGFDLRVQYITIDGIFKIRIAILNIGNFDIFFDVPTNTTEVLKKLVAANMNIVAPECMSLLSDKINDYFDLHYNETINIMSISHFYLFYFLNITNVTYSENGLTFKALYNILDLSKIKISSRSLFSPFNFNELIPNPMPDFNAKNIKLPADFFQEAINTAHEKHFFDYQLNETNIQIRGFSFFVGDLSLAMPSVTNSYYPDTRVDVFCGSNDDSPPQFQVFNIVLPIKIYF